MTDATDLAKDEGVSKTVYSIYWPFTRDRIDRVWQTERETIRRQYEEAWTKKQDALHDPFLERWAEWATPVRPAITPLTFPHRYPTSGSSEALRETLADFAANRRDNALHVFAGEYEGRRGGEGRRLVDSIEGAPGLARRSLGDQRALPSRGRGVRPDLPRQQGAVWKRSSEQDGGEATAPLSAQLSMRRRYRPATARLERADADCSAK